VWTLHDDFTYSYDAAGHHDLKTGGEYLHLLDNTRNCNRCGGVITANGGPVPATSKRSFPIRSTRIPGTLHRGNGRDQYALHGRRLGLDELLTPIRMDKYGAWVQDDWKATSRLTLNLGARYDLIWNAFAQNVNFPPFELPGRPQDANNIQPRLGFAYTLSDRTVCEAARGCTTTTS
jgi:outer membrane receptor protein involved in Fe transport